MLRTLFRTLRHTAARRADAPADRPARASELLERGRTALREGRYTDAERALLEILTIDPVQRDALSMLGQVYMRRLQFATALDYFDEVLRRGGDLAASHANRAGALLGLGRYAEALESARRAAALEPDSFMRAADVLFVLNQDPQIAPEQRYAEHRRVAAQFLDRSPRWVLPDSRFDDPERRLRIGYLSGDFRDHAVAFFIEPLLASRDRAAFEVFCYQTLGKQDARTERWRALADGWYEVKDLSDARLGHAIVDERIDILVDLAGLTRGNRAIALARKPAPVQISYLGYLATTGTRAIDYRITDALADPPGAADRCHSEQLIRLPRSLWCFAPWAEMPAPAARAAAADAPIVFGSFNRLTKLHPPVLRLWARLLERVANSELWILDVPGEEGREGVLAAFRELGIAESRVITQPRQLREDYWQTVRRADIALDPFPYNGGATTCESLWLGVPVVTRAGAMGVARSGASILANAGLPELVAGSDEEYLEIAAALATDRPRLRALQEGLRDRMRASPLLDATGFMRDLERAYREVWRRACAEHQPLQLRGSALGHAWRATRPTDDPGSRKENGMESTAHPNPLFEYFKSNPGRLIHKWLPYFEPYHRHLERFRGQAVTLLEFGVSHGGSLQMWKHYLGARARIVGVDIVAACKAFEEEQVSVRIGDQEDRAFLRRLAEEFAPIDIVIDDGGHTMAQQLATFEELFFHMSDFGVYVAEDLHTSYWREYGGGCRRSGTFIEYAKTLVDRLNAWHTQDPEVLAVDDFTRQAASVHFYDSMLVIERAPGNPPGSFMSGRPSD